MSKWNSDFRFKVSMKSVRARNAVIDGVFESFKCETQFKQSIFFPLDEEQT